MSITVSLATFKIAQNTLRLFTLAEGLLMAAMNQVEAKRKPAETRNPLNFMQAQLKARETSHPYYQWIE